MLPLEFSQAQLVGTPKLVQTLTDANAFTGNVGDQVRTLEDLSKAKNLRISGLEERSSLSKHCFRFGTLFMNS